LTAVRFTKLLPYLAPAGKTQVEIEYRQRRPGLVKGGFYQQLATYGHMGRMDIGLPWEVTDKIAMLQEHAASL
jgi:S-adenosylmethionine synthetase